MKKYMILIIALFAINAYSMEWEFDDAYKNERLYIHALTNYELNPKWHLDWEKNFIHRNGMKLSFGSVTTEELMCNVQLVINEELGNGWRFREYFHWYASRHRNTEEKSNFMGFEKEIWNGFSSFLLFHTAYHKEEMDMKWGVGYANPNREKYVRFAIAWNDFVYDSKNDKGGKTLQNAPVFQWNARVGKGNWWIFSQGKYTDGFKRNYADPELSSVSFHQQKINDAAIKFYYELSPTSLIEISTFYYYFYERKRYRTPEYDYSYRNNIYQHTLRYLFDLNSRINLRSSVHYVWQNSDANGFRNYTYERRELFFPAIFVEFRLAQEILELGYFGSSYKWDHDEGINADDFSEDGYIDKLKLGWTHEFNDHAKLQVSISHVVSISGFGGGNLQYIMFF